MRRRPVSPFSLSFLDIMFCGFGAVVLLVLILNADTVRARNAVFADLRAEVVQLEKQALTGRENLVEARNSLEATEQDLVRTEGESGRVLRLMDELAVEIAALRDQTQARRAHINALSSDLKNLDEEQKRLGAQTPDEGDDGSKVHRITGDGERQYLTGLKVGGQRILLLLDASASMLDDTVVNVIRRRNMSDAQKRAAPKWRRALASAEWLIANLPPGARFQVYAFDTRARSVLSARQGQGQGQWLSASSADDVRASVSALHDLVPGDGTSLYHAFAAARSLSPRPDNILLVTDGLPTQGRGKPSGSTVSADQRLDHFLLAMAEVPAGTPVNTLLLPMEGDAYAAVAYWKLAMDTGGSFITPAKDWP